MTDEKSPKDELAEIAARRAARRVENEDADTDQELRNARAIDAAEEKYTTVLGKGLRALAAPNGEIVIVRKPAFATFRKFQDSKEKAHDAASAFVKGCLVHPEREAYAALLEEYPGMLMRLVTACAEMAGHATEEK